MYFKSIEMRGFKSFVDETALTFEPGVTAIVGPNGCGKSNIADGIRWVLGEQSPKHMRGGKMEDFIFNGSGRRKPAGYAQVSITMVNSDGRITTQPYAEYPEITVTRKLYRTGDSEYFINKVPCRLKDIVDIFLDTGISTRSLSIIEQGQVTAIVNSKPEERRGIIEEAAGVMKFKARRNAALNKLSASQQNLLRIQDILGELEKQRNSLNRQAKKAERFQAFRAEIRDKALDYYANEYQSHVGQFSILDGRLAGRREKEAAVAAELSTRKNRVETLAAAIGDEERQAGALREERYLLSSKIDRNENHITLLTRQIDELGSIETENEREIARLEEGIVAAEAEREGRTGDVASLEERIGVMTARKAELDAEMAGVRERLSARQNELAGKQRESMEAMRRFSEANNRKGQLATRLEMADTRLAGLVERRAEAIAQVEQAEGAVADLARRLEEKEAATAAERENNQSLKAEAEEAARRLNEASDALRRVENEITKHESRLESLRELERNMEGFGEGIRGLMKLKDQGKADALDIRGLLADGLRVSPELETALAAVLGERLEAALVADESAVTEAVRLLREGAVGRAILLAGGIDAAAVHRVDGPSDHPALVGRAVDLVTFAAAAPEAARRALTNVFVARDLPGALDMWRSHPGCAMVTLDGDLVDADGFVTGGGKPAGQGAAIVARKRLIEELVGQLAGLETERAAGESARSDVAAQVETARAQLAESGERLRSLDMETVGLRKEAQGRAADLDRAGRTVEGLDRESAQLTAERNRIGEEEARLSAETAELEERKNRLDADVAAATTEIEEFRRALESVTGRVREEEVAVTEVKGRLNAARADVSRLEAQTADLVGRVERLKNSRGENARRRSEMNESIATMREENVGFARSRDDVAARLTTFTEALEQKSSERENIDREIRELDRELEELRAAIADEAVRLSELKMRVENVVEKADHEFNIPIEDLAGRDLTVVDLDETSRRLSFLRGELGRIGDVNMSALEEFQEVDERYEFMKSQHGDLVTSISQLRKTIDSLNATTEKLFMEAFEQVSSNFTAVFKRLFGGGNAEMRLVDEEGKSEPGVEILVQPPGKKVQHLNLLSAGEKAMTAIALLFAVFMKQPSPFCLLDEVDAPLDEANIFRFRDMVMEMTEKTQFIIITHSQKTMSFAERLYGVTQEEEGVSKVLAVDIDDARQRPLAVA